MQQDTGTVHIIGAGWAGLAAAVTLAGSGLKVEVHESARQAGGRARSAPFGNLKVDNGQHLMIGAYSEMLRLMSRIGLNHETLFTRFPLELRTLGSRENGAIIRTAGLPYPLNLLGTFLSSKGLSGRDYLAIARLFMKMSKVNYRLDKDISVDELLSGQPASIRNKLWEPVCLAGLNTPPAVASANIFMKVLQDSFIGSRRNSDLLIPAVDLGNTFPAPAIDFIESNSGYVHLGKRVTNLQVSNNQISGIVIDNQVIPADNVILATPWHQAKALMKEHAKLSGIVKNLEKISAQPICTVYLEYPASTRLDFPMTGVVGGAGQWIFDRRICNQPGVMAVVISANGPHMELDKKELAALIIKELSLHFPRWPGPDNFLVIREKRATFSANVDIDMLRPGNQTPVNGLMLAGDYTSTGYPATLEGAVRSGVQCAQLLIDKQENRHD